MSKVAEIPTAEEINLLVGLQLDTVLIQLDETSCNTEAAIAAVLNRAEATGHYAVDGHRSVRAWAQATCNWSRTAALAHVRVARLIAGSSDVDDRLRSGRLGLPQVAELARLRANPRCGHLLVDVLDVLIDAARTLRFDEFAVVCRRWEQQADEDGAHRDHDTARKGRRVRTGIVGEAFALDADGDAVDGTEIIEILARFTDAEFLADWEQLQTRLGDQATVSQLDRTNAQRRFDALVTIFRTAAAANATPSATEPTVNVIVDWETFQQHMTDAFGVDLDDDEPEPASDANRDVDVNDAAPASDINRDVDVNDAAPACDINRDVDVDDGGPCDVGADDAAATGVPTATTNSDSDRTTGAATDVDGAATTAHPHATTTERRDFRRFRCETTTGVLIDPDTMIAAAVAGRLRRVVFDSTGTVIDLGRRQRLFTGSAAQAIRLAHRHCIWPGCTVDADRAQCDHVEPWATARGPTNPTNGTTLCGHHNRFKTRGYRTWRDPTGTWHTYRPDGTEIAPLR